jgi:uncharacterized membrane protein
MGLGMIYAFSLVFGSIASVATVFAASAIQDVAAPQSQQTVSETVV